jgi:hypothetical protein
VSRGECLIPAYGVKSSPIPRARLPIESRRSLWMETQWH